MGGSRCGKTGPDSPKQHKGSTADGGKNNAHWIRLDYVINNCAPVHEVVNGNKIKPRLKFHPEYISCAGDKDKHQQKNKKHAPEHIPVRTGGEDSFPAPGPDR